MAFRIPAKVKKLAEKFKEEGAQIFVVGGAVRDMLLKRPVKDWDFTTNLTPEEMAKLFPKNGFCNNAYGTFSVVGKNKEIFEITTFRTERGYSDKRHPDQISWGENIEEDLSRRDFTINALALNLGTKTKVLVDLFGGRDDLKNELIKAVGEPDKRFKEDALRMLRAVRIATELGFTIEKETLKSIRENAQLIKEVAGERIREEIFRILLAAQAAKGFQLLKDSGLLKEIMPELLEGEGIVQKGHHIYDVWIHNLKALENCESNDPVTKLACLLHDVGKPVVVKGEGPERTFHNHEMAGAKMAVNIGKRLRLSKKDLDKLYRLVRWHMFSTAEVQTDKAVRRFIRHVTPEYVDEMIKLRRADRLGSGAKETSWRWELFKNRVVEVQKQPFSIKDLKVNGEDVMRILKIKPGRMVGEVLNRLFAEVEEEPSLNNKTVLTKRIVQIGKILDII
jgi:tRNA nucleotidyltransferase (CCA-adding enzyme)